MSLSIVAEVIKAIEIAKKFGAPESAGFVNGVIDRIARSLRPSAPRGRPVAQTQAKE